MLEEAEIGLARVRVDLFDRTHGCICSEYCSVTSPAHAEFGDSILFDQGAHLVAECVPDRSSSFRSFGRNHKRYN